MVGFRTRGHGFIRPDPCEGEEMPDNIFVHISDIGQLFSDYNYNIKNISQEQLERFVIPCLVLTLKRKVSVHSVDRPAKQIFCYQSINRKMSPICDF